MTPDVLYIDNFLAKSEADALEFRLRAEVAFDQKLLKMYGREVPIPHLEAWYGEHDYPYSAGLVLKAKPFPEYLRALMFKVEKAIGENFNSVLINRYRNGRDYIGWHSDDDYGSAEPTIPGLTLGATRRFLIRHKQTKEIVEFAPVHGSLIVMRGRTNADWVHSVPKQLREKGERLNLTFRKMGDSQ